MGQIVVHQEVKESLTVLVDVRIVPNNSLSLYVANVSVKVANKQNSVPLVA